MIEPNTWTAAMAASLRENKWTAGAAVVRAAKPPVRKQPRHISHDYSPQTWKAIKAKRYLPNGARECARRLRQMTVSP
jgi:hypothetical protein